MSCDSSWQRVHSQKMYHILQFNIYFTHVILFIKLYLHCAFVYERTFNYAFFLEMSFQGLNMKNS